MVIRLVMNRSRMSFSSAPITGALWLLQMDTIYLLSHPQVCCYGWDSLLHGAAHWYSHCFIILNHNSGSSNVILFFCSFASMRLGCIIHHVGLHVQQLFCTTAATTTWIHTIGKAAYSATVLILPLSIQCTLSLHTCNLIFTMTSLTIKIDFLPLLLLIIAVCKQGWASYCQNIIHYILLVAVIWK